MGIEHLYGTFSSSQIAQAKQSLRGSIFFLLLCVDPNTCKEYPNVDVLKCFNGLMLKIGGLNSLLQEQPELVNILSLLEAAKNEYTKINFDFSVYRKLILDAGAEVLRLKDGD